MKKCESCSLPIDNDDRIYECWKCGLKFCDDCLVMDKQMWQYSNRTSRVGYTRCPKCKETIGKYYQGKAMTLQELLTKSFGKMEGQETRRKV